MGVEHRGLEQVVCVLQLTCVNCTRWTRDPVLCATACTVTCRTCDSTCVSSTTLRVSHVLYVTSRSRPSSTSSVIWSASTSSCLRIVSVRRTCFTSRSRFRYSRPRRPRRPSRRPPPTIPTTVNSSKPAAAAR